MIDISVCKKAAFPNAALVACQGVEGAYSQIAANTAFTQPDIMYMRTFDGVFRAVDKGLCQYGILPVENSNAGTVTAVYDLMKAYNFYIVRSVKVSVSHMLLSNKNAKAKEIKEIYTHEQAAQQCSKFLEENPQIKLTIYSNTAAAAKLVAESGRDDIAAIASINCAELYNLSILQKGFQNTKNNYTRFICISKKCEIFDNADKISLMLTIEHKPGALYEVIKQFAERKLNLTKLESRPIADTDFEFMFYFDAQANIGDSEVRSFLDRLEQSVKHFVFLGNYSECESGSSPTDG